VYPDIDDPAQPIGPIVADLTGGEPSCYGTPAVTFTMNSARDFVFSVLNTHSGRGPGTLTVTGPGGVFAEHTDTNTNGLQVGMYFFEMKGFQAGDIFTLTGTKPGNTGIFSAVAFDTIAAPTIFQITNVDRDPATGEVTLTFPSSDSDTYKVDASTDLVGWTELDDNLDGQAVETSYTDTIFAPDPAPTGQAKVFYRVTKNP